MGKRKSKKSRQSANASPQAAVYTTSEGKQGSELYEWLTGNLANASAVTQKTALSLSAIYASLNLIGGAVSALPLPIYERTSEGKRRIDHDYWWMLNQEYSTPWLASAAREHHVTSILMRGAGYVWIRRPRPSSDLAIGLTPLSPDETSVHRIGGGFRYESTDPDTGRRVKLNQADVLHFPGFGFDAATGRCVDPIRQVLRTNATLGLAALEFSSRFFSNSARPDFVLKSASNLTDEQIEQLRSMWLSRHQGESKAFLPTVLGGGLDLQTLSMSNRDGQLNETRRLEIEELARFFGVPPFMIGHTEKTTSWGSGIEEMTAGFLKFTLTRHLKRIEQELNRKLFGQRSPYFCEFNTAGLERGVTKDRYEAYRIGLGRAGEPGFLRVNEVRKWENLEPIDGGDELFNGGSDATQSTTEPAGAE